mgnify:CR=1 FL=1
MRKNLHPRIEGPFYWRNLLIHLKHEALQVNTSLKMPYCPIYVKQGAGLQNFGNTCYLNSVLQCLTYTEPFVAYLQSGEHMSSCKFIASGRDQQFRYSA